MRLEHLTLDEQRLALRVVALLRQDTYVSVKITKQGAGKRLRLTREATEEI